MADPAATVPDDVARLSLGQESTVPLSMRDGNNGIVATDITAKFAEAVKAISPGDLVKDGFFTLFESVAALEIMDPKMDSGCVDPDDEFEELYDVSRPLCPEEVLGIIDELLCHEMSWHLGYPLSQTILTSVYVEALLMPPAQRIEDATFIRDGSFNPTEHPALEVLRAYCLGMLKVCGYVNKQIASEHFYEEEDFVTNTYHRSLLEDISASSIQKCLVDAQRLLQTMSDSVEESVVQALTTRLELRRIYLDAVESAQHRNDPKRAMDPWKRGCSILEDIFVSHSLSKPVEESFSAKLQRKLASTMPPRPIVHLRFEDAFEHLSRLFQDGLELIGILRYSDTQSLLTFVNMFQSKKPQPLVYVRSLMQTFMLHEMEVLGSMSIRQLLDDDFSIITLPASSLLDRSYDEIEVVHDPRFVISQQMEIFRKRAAQSFVDLLQTSCQNRSRVRRTLCHVINDWENLQADAEEIDQILQEQVDEQPLLQPSADDGPAIEIFALPLSSWTYLYKLRHMESVIQLGFELDVYQKDELAGMYWYLNYLAKSRLRHSERIKSFIIHRFDEIRQQPGTRDRSKDEQIQKSLAFTRLSLLDAAVTWELSDALSCLYAVLGRVGLLVGPPRPYSNDELRYELRMKPFASVGLPILPTFEEFTEGTMQPESSADELLEYGARAVTGARKGFEALGKLSAEDSFSVGSHERWSTTIKNGLRSCIATGVAIMTLQKGIAASQKGGPLKLKAEVPTPDQVYHDWWIVPRVLPNL